MPFSITSTRCAGVPSLSNSYVPESFTPSSSRSVGSSMTLRNFGSTSWPTFFVNVCPSSSSRCRCPSSLCPSTSWKNTAAARPLSSAGPSYGSATGAARSDFRSVAIFSIFAAISASLGKPLGRGAWNVSTRSRSMPSSARVCASITSRAEPLGVAISAPSLDTMRELDDEICKSTVAK